MAFPNAEVENQRVETAAALGLSLDPRSKGDLAVVTVLSVIYGLDLIAIALLLWNRKYPPIKSKGPYMMTCLFLCSAFWFIGDLQVNGHVQLAGSVLTNCRGFGFWVRVLLGICGVCGVVALRTYALYHVFQLNLPSRGLRFYLPLLAYIACILVFGIVASALSPSVSAEYMAPLDICRLDKPFKIAIFVFVWIASLFVGIVNWKIRHIRSSFNESREMLIGCLVVFVVLTFNTCMQFIHQNYPLQQKYRIPSTVLDHVCCNALLWVIIGKPLFLCLFKRQKYLQQWVATLRSDGLQRAYEIDSSHSAETLQPVAKLQKEYPLGFFYAESPQHSFRPESMVSWNGARDEIPESQMVSWPQASYSGFGADRRLI
ncbi:hypothetical protein EV183_005636 [Coemansia sp. RSA 2336]|nr:hypothetical protein EV183_005636 [Coemansia sp. RSA 2336]